MTKSAQHALHNEDTAGDEYNSQLLQAGCLAIQAIHRYLSDAQGPHENVGR
jgi:hypothetical protein